MLCAEMLGTSVGVSANKCTRVARSCEASSSWYRSVVIDALPLITNTSAMILSASTRTSRVDSPGRSGTTAKYGYLKWRPLHP